MLVHARHILFRIRIYLEWFQQQKISSERKKKVTENCFYFGLH